MLPLTFGKSYSVGGAVADFGSGSNFFMHYRKKLFFLFPN